MDFTLFSIERERERERDFDWFLVYIYNYIIFQPKSVGRSVGQSTSRHIEVGRTRLRIGFYVIFNREREKERERER